MKKPYAPIYVSLLAVILLVLTGCATIPKPSEDSEGLIAISLETTGDYSYTGEGRWLEIKNSETGETILRKSFNSDGVKYIKLREGSYRFIGFFKASNGDFARGSSEPVSIGRGEFIIYPFQLNRDFKKNDRGFTPKNLWIPLEAEVQEKILVDFRESDNGVYWELALP